MKHITKLKLAAIHQLMDAEDRSTEYMIQYMQDTCKVSFDTVMNYLQLPQEEKQANFKLINELLLFIESLDLTE